MNPKVFWLITAILLASTCIVEAQQAKKVSKIGYLEAASASANPTRREAFQQGLRELGYIEGQNIVVEYRYADGIVDRLPSLAAELVHLKVDVIVSAGPAATRPAQMATSKIPIVMAFDNDPVGSGFVTNLARPGGNITGLSALAPELSGKRLELLKDTISKLSRLQILGTSSEPGYAQTLKETELAAEVLKVHLQYQDVLSPKDIDTGFEAAINHHADAVLVLTGPVLISQRSQLTRLAIKNRIPSMYYRREYVESGGLMSYGVSYTDLDRRAAAYVDKILRGAKPADLPVEQPTKFELVINSENGKTNRPHNSTNCSGEGGQGDQVTV